MAKHKCFISYHKADQDEVDAFIKEFGDDKNIFIHRAVREMDQNIIDSTDNDYIMRRIREKYLTDSTVTVVLVGKCTWARKYVDWEVMSSLRNDTNNKRSGLLAINLKSMGSTSKLPGRVADNRVSKDGVESGYAHYYTYPTRKDTLANWIQDAFDARTDRGDLAKNSRDRRINNGACE